MNKEIKYRLGIILLIAGLVTVLLLAFGCNDTKTCDCSQELDSLYAHIEYRDSVFTMFVFNALAQMNDLAEDGEWGEVPDSIETIFVPAFFDGKGYFIKLTKGDKRAKIMLPF